jgi:hypothetical protein
MTDARPGQDVHVVQAASLCLITLWLWDIAGSRLLDGAECNSIVSLRARLKNPEVRHVSLQTGRMALPDTMTHTLPCAFTAVPGPVTHVVLLDTTMRPGS